MRKVVISLVVGVALSASAPAALASTPRADTYFQVWCTTPDTPPGGDPIQAESVDAHAIQPDKAPGGKDDAILRFGQNHPGWNCWWVGPITR
jgi:hypothetical protein